MRVEMLIDGGIGPRERDQKNTDFLSKPFDAVTTTRDGMEETHIKRQKTGWEQKLNRGKDEANHDTERPPYTWEKAKPTVECEYVCMRI